MANIMCTLLIAGVCQVACGGWRTDFSVRLDVHLRASGQVSSTFGLRGGGANDRQEDEEGEEEVQCPADEAMLLGARYGELEYVKMALSMGVPVSATSNDSGFARSNKHFELAAAYVGSLNLNGVYAPMYNRQGTLMKRATRRFILQQVHAFRHM